MRFPQFVAVALGCVISSSAFAEKVVPDLVFAKPDGKELALDLYLPEGVSNPPLLVYIHGGAWMAGSRKGVPFRWLVNNGFALASISYRFTDVAAYPAQIQDCKAAVRWLREHAAEYGYDAKRVGVLGESAGGHLAVLMGTTSDDKRLEPEGATDKESSTVQAVVDFYGPTDFILRAKTQPQMTEKPDSRVYKLLGGSPTEKPEVAKLASGSWQASAGDAPIIIFHGGSDNVVPIGQSERLLEAAKAAGIVVSMHVVPSAGHQVEPFLTPEYKKLIVDFLNKQLKGKL